MPPAGDGHALGPAACWGCPCQGSSPDGGGTVEHLQGFVSCEGCERRSLSSAAGWKQLEEGRSENLIDLKENEGKMTHNEV